MQSEFDGGATINSLLSAFYNKYDLGEDGGLKEPAIKIVLYKNICFYLPNIDARRKVVLKHDIHHIVTGYKSDFKGETEIGAWEIASGCEKYWVGLVLNTYSLMTGFLFNLPGIFKAFVRGKRTKNLYNLPISDEQAVAMTTDELREKMGLNMEYQQPATFKEIVSFLAWSAAGAIFSVLSVLLLPFVLLFSLTMSVKKKANPTF